MNIINDILNTQNGIVNHLERDDKVNNILNIGFFILIGTNTYIFLLSSIYTVFLGFLIGSIIGAASLSVAWCCIRKIYSKNKIKKESQVRILPWDIHFKELKKLTKDPQYLERQKYPRRLLPHRRDSGFESLKFEFQ